MNYNVKKMKSDLIKAAAKVEQEIQDTFEIAFKDIYKSNMVPADFKSEELKIIKKTIGSDSDFNGIPSRSGFYIILTDCPIKNNDCSLTYGNLTAVYRGQASKVKKRLTSHLSNRQYNLDYELRREKYLKEKDLNAKFYEVHFGACMKFHPKHNGINVIDPQYKDYQWVVIVHEMLDSSERVRELAELAFDGAFGHPIASRE
jgi:hypothetical protein